MPRGVYPRTKGQTDRPTDRPTDRVVSVSAIDYPGLLAQLEQQRAAAVQEIADLDVIIPAVRQRAGRVVPAELTLPPPRNGGSGTHGIRAPRPAHGPTDTRPVGRVGLSADKVATIRTQYEAGVSGPTIEERTGVNRKTIYKRAKLGGWKRPAEGAAKPAPVETPKGHQLSGSVKCTNDDCGKWTSTDPCGQCGKPLKRKF